MEPPSPSPPLAASGGISPLRPHPRGLALQWDALVPPRRQHAHAKVSPRHIKLQSVGGAAIAPPLPVFATAALRDQLQGHFRHELFQLHQTLQDAVAHCGALDGNGAVKSEPERRLALELERSGASLTVLTSDHHAAVMREFFRQWQLALHTSNASGAVSVHEHELLCEVVDAIFRNLPTVLTDSDARNAKSIMRLVDSLKAMRELVLALLYKTHGSARPHDRDDDTDNDDHDQHHDASSKAPPSALFASTSALLAAIGGPTTAAASVSPARHTQRAAAPPARIPLYLYCQQLERELETLSRRLRTVRGRGRGGKDGDDDVELLHEQTLALLVQFWELPKRERLAFFCQVASQAKRDDCDAVLRVFLDKCDGGQLLSLWDALQLTPHVQHALAMRAHGDDAEAAGHAAAEALAAASQDVEARHQRKNRDGSDGDSSGDDSDDGQDGDGSGRCARRGKRFAVAAARGHRPSQQQVDLHRLTDVFERDDEDLQDGDDFDGGDGWGHGGGKRRRRKLRVRDRGRTPESSRGHGHGGVKRGGDARRAQHPKELEPVRPTSSTPPTPTQRPVLDRVHSTLLELLKRDDDPAVDAGITDAAWRLVELIDRAKRHDSVAQRGAAPPPRRLSTFQQQPSVALAAPSPRGASSQHSSDPLGHNLTPDQQLVVKMDQLQSLLASLGGVSLHAMDADTISSAFKRAPALSRLFQAFQGKVYAAVGLDAPPHAAAATSATTAVGHSHTTSATTAVGHSHTTSAAHPQARADAVAAVAPAWADETVMDSVEVMLAKLGKMVRSLAPIAVAGANSGGADASSEILKLAEAMEEIAASSHTSSGHRGGSAAARRHLSLDPARRLAMLNRLKSLAQSNQIESLTGLLTTTSDDIAALRAVSDHQQRQLQAFTGSDCLAGEDEDEDESSATAVDEAAGGRACGDVDDVLKLVKKAKNRRASAAKLASSGGNASGAANDGEDDDDQNLLMHPDTAPRYANRADISLTFKQAAAQRGSKLFSAGILLRVVDQMYREHYEAMCASPQYGSRRMEFSEFMYDWHIRKYGLKALAQQHLLKLIQSLRRHERKVFPCHLCLRFLGIVSPLGFHEHKFVLGLLDKWSAGSFSGAARHRVEYVPRQFKVRVTFAVATLQEALSERFGVYFRTMDAVTARVKAHAMRPDEEFIKESELLTIALDEWLAQRQRIEQILSAVYAAGDLNGDGSLESDEFSAVLFHLSPALTDKFVQRVFTAAHDFLKPRRISFERFLDVVLLERVLNTNAPSGKSRFTAAAAAERAAGNGNASSSAATTASAGGSATATASGASVRATGEDEEIYQFNLLQETWEHDCESVAQALAAIPHAPTVASLQFRVTFLTQILSKRVDSKTAWMCHRQIMREIRKYQNLNDDQIVAVKTKEETFKKAVMAIRNLQRLSVAFRRPTVATAAESGVGELTPPQEPVGEDHDVSGEVDAPVHELLSIERSHHGPDELQKMTSYMSVVEGALVASDGGASSSLADMEALEDQLREKFLERADEDAIDDFKSALQTIRRLSVQAFPADLDASQLLASREEKETKRASVLLGGVMEEEDEGEEEEEEEEEDEDEEGEENEDDEAV